VRIVCFWIFIMLSGFLLLRSLQEIAQASPDSPDGAKMSAKIDPHAPPPAPEPKADVAGGQRASEIYRIEGSGSAGWFGVIAALSGVLLGGAISVFGVWLKDRMERRHAIRRWVEEEFVLGAIEPVLQLLRRMRLLLSQREASILTIGNSGELPVTELSRIRILLHTDTLTEFTFRLGQLARHAASASDAGQRAVILVEAQESELLKLEKYLLGAVLKDKSAIHDMGNSKFISALAARVEANRQRLFEIVT
jgi:hypothetical protein